MCSVLRCLRPSTTHLSTEDISKLGEVLLMSHLRVEGSGGERRERLFLLFPGVLVMLSMGAQVSGYVYEGKLPTSGMQVEAVAPAAPANNGLESGEDDDDDDEHAFVMEGNLIDRRLVVCSTHKEQVTWLDMLRDQAKHGPVYIPTKPQSLQISSSQPAISQLSQAKTAHLLAPAKLTWSMSCLRPCPPLRPSTFVKEEVTRSPRTGRKLLPAGYASLRRKPADEMRTLEDDALLLKVIEAYCTSAKTRHTVNSSLLDSPQVLVAEDEKIIVEELKGDQTVVEEKSLVDTVYSLRDTVSDLKQEQAKLRKDLEEEKRSRRKLETLLRKTMRSMQPDTASIHTLTDNESVAP